MEKKKEMRCMEGQFNFPYYSQGCFACVFLNSELKFLLSSPHLYHSFGAAAQLLFLLKPKQNNKLHQTLYIPNAS